MNILALDLATRTGWALYENGRIMSGVQDFSKQRGESNGMLFLKFHRWLEQAGDVRFDSAMLAHGIKSEPRFHLLVYEQAHHRGGAATEIAVGLVAHAQAFCAAWNVEHTSVHSMTLKKWATGSGKASKEQMCAAAMGYLIAAVESGSAADTSAWRHRIADDNEADAILLLGYALEKYGEGTACNAQIAAATERA